MLDKNAKIYVAGHHGLVGSAIWNNLMQRGYTNLVGRSHRELDLLDGAAVKAFFDEEQPDAVVLAAAHVGGIMANLQYRADFIYQNLQIQQNVIGESFRHGVKKLLFLGSTCIYPREAPQPMKEDVSVGIYQRAVCHRQDSGAEDVREFQPAIRYELHRRDADKPLRAERQFPFGEQSCVAGHDS